MIETQERAELESHAHQAGIHALFLAPLPAMLLAAGLTVDLGGLAVGGVVWLVGQLCVGVALLTTRAPGARLASTASLATGLALFAVLAFASGASLILMIPALIMSIIALPLRWLARALARDPIPRARVR